MFADVTNVQIGHVASVSAQRGNRLGLIGPYRAPKGRTGFQFFLKGPSMSTNTKQKRVCSVWFVVVRSCVCACFLLLAELGALMRRAFVFDLPLRML